MPSGEGFWIKTKLVSLDATISSPTIVPCGRNIDCSKLLIPGKAFRRTKSQRSSLYFIPRSESAGQRTWTRSCRDKREAGASASSAWETHQVKGRPFASAFRVGTRQAEQLVS